MQLTRRERRGMVGCTEVVGSPELPVRDAGSPSGTSCS